MIKHSQEFQNEEEVLEQLEEGEIVVVVKKKDKDGEYLSAHGESQGDPKNMRYRIDRLKIGAGILYGDHRNTEIKEISKCSQKQ